MISSGDRAYLAALCLARAGLKVDAEKAYLIESRLSPVARREGFSSVEDLIAAVRDRGDEALGWAAVEAMAAPETNFFRDPAALEQLVEKVLPALARARGDAPVRVWSTVCGGGHEIYSLAMRLADAPELAARIELFASDLSARNLEKAQAARYSQFEVQQGLPARMLVRHFEKDGESFALSPRIRQSVRWRRANLMDDTSRLGEFDLLLCRNVLGQLAAEAQGRILDHLARVTAPGGLLLLGRDAPAAARFALVDAQMGLYAPHDAPSARSAA